MISEVNNPNEYINQLPEDRRKAMLTLRETIVNNLPDGFTETMSYGMISYVFPHSIYAPGYHCNPKEPVPFISIASQKNFIALYHMGIYSYPELLAWFVQEYPKHVKTKLDMGKSCIRFKKMDNIPYDLIAELCSKITVEDFLERYKKWVQR
jgi:uncharacterized protein YdhG (YjbR/CyaY superfamily)